MYSTLRNIFILLVITLFCACRHKQPKPITEQEYHQVKKHMPAVNKILIQRDRQRIIGWLNRNNLEMTETKNGLWYKIDKQGNGPKAEKGKTAVINYKISLLDGKLCYDSKTSGPKKFLIGQGGVESGLEEGILLLRQGAKATFIMPPHLAYGLPGDGDKIPARAIILYQVELVALK